MKPIQIKTGAKTPAAPGPPESRKTLMEKYVRALDRVIPPEFLADPEEARRARLVSNFGVTGAIFGLVYCIFYLLIGHEWGAMIIAICSACFATAPGIVRWRRNINLAGEFLILIMAGGFTGLCYIEGGLQGHAIAWLVGVPLCAFLLLGEKAAIRWAVIALIDAGIIAGLDLAGVDFEVTYDPKWNAVVSSAGYLGLITFLFILGFIFERGRTRAMAKMNEALANLARSNERLTLLNDEKNEFLGIAAHDLKNPLTAILGNAQLGMMTGDVREARKSFNKISDIADRMHGLIRNLLDINAIEQKGFKFRIEECDILQLVEQSIESNQVAANKKMIEVRLGASAHFQVKADRSAVLQILDNLVSNALKYSLSKSNVQIHVMQEETMVLVAVRDEGPGISESDQRRLFQKFTRLSARPTGGESSTGLGLAIVKRLAEAMGGTVQCKSSPGCGSTFTLALPLVGAASALPKTAMTLAEAGVRMKNTERINFIHFHN